MGRRPKFAVNLRLWESFFLKKIYNLIFYKNMSTFKCYFLESKKVLFL